MTEERLAVFGRAIQDIVRAIVDDFDTGARRVVLLACSAASGEDALF